MKPYETPHALSRDEVARVVEQFRHAASIALAANFDGVEIHGANGYLIDQFLQTGTNHRDDEYGGSVEHRTDFLVDVARAVVDVWGGGRVGVRLSPGGGMNGIHDDDPVETFSYAAHRLDQMQDIVYLHVVEAPVGSSGPDERRVCATRLLRPIFRRTLISTGGYSPASAEHVLEKHEADLIGFGRLFIANPDLPERIRAGALLNEPDQATFYTPGEHGYTDYPTMESVAA
jgi:N-ethylmaleimide reductase